MCGNMRSWAVALVAWAFLTHCTPASCNERTIGAGDECIAPIITSHPTGTQGCQGKPMSFSVSAEGTAPLSYQWRKGGANIVGASQAVYTIQSVWSSHAGDYDCVVTNSCGSAVSNPATLTVSIPPSRGWWGPATVCPGYLQIILSVQSSATPPLTYQWKKGNVDIPGATGQYYYIQHVKPSDAGDYYCLVKNACGEALWGPAPVNVLPAPVITVQPKDQEACTGRTATFTIAATANEPLRYQWQFATMLPDIYSQDIPGATGTQLTVTASQEGFYSCRVSNSTCTTISRYAYLHTSSSYFTGKVIVRVLNPEGYDLNDSRVSGRYYVPSLCASSDSVSNYSRNRDEQVVVSKLCPGPHTIYVKYNGMLQEKNVTLAQGETKELTFVFPRTVFDLSGLLSSNGGHAKVEVEGRHYDCEDPGSSVHRGSQSPSGALGCSVSASGNNVAYYALSETRLTGSMFQVDLIAYSTPIGDCSSWPDDGSPIYPDRGSASCSATWGMPTNGAAIDPRSDFTYWLLEKTRTGSYPDLVFRKSTDYGVSMYQWSGFPDRYYFSADQGTSINVGWTSGSLSRSKSYGLSTGHLYGTARFRMYNVPYGSETQGGGGPVPQQPKKYFGSLWALPGTVAADGVKSCALTLALKDQNGDPVSGKRIEFTSVRGSADTITQPEMVTDALGMVTGSIRSTTAGSTTVRARDLTDEVDLSCRAEVTFEQPIGEPILARVTSTASGPYLSRIPFSNTFTAYVADWGTGAGPGRVEFRLNGAAHSVEGDESGASRSFDMGADLKSGSCLTDNTLEVVAFNEEGKASKPITLILQCIDPAPWMIAGALYPVRTVCLASGELEYSLEFCYPDVDIDATASVPDWVPIIGGKSGAELRKVCAGVKISGGKITGTLGGGAKLFVAGREGEWMVTGSAGFCVCPLKLRDAQIELSGSIDFPVVNAKNWPIPGVEASVNISPELSLSGGLEEGDGSCGFVAPGGSWHFRSGTGSFGLGVSGSIKAGIDEGMLSASGTLGVSGGATIQLPGNPADCCGSEWLKELTGTLFASVKGSVLGLSKEKKLSWDFWKCGGGSAPGVVPSGRTRAGNSLDTGWHRDSREYLNAVKADGRMTALGESGEGESLVPNVYPQASPCLATKGVEAVVAYCRDTGAPEGSAFLQIGAMQYKDGAWAALPDVSGAGYPAVEPSIVYDSAGKPVCVWVGLPTWTGAETDPTELLPKMEVFASSYDGSAWSAAQRLTNNAYLDTLPRIIRGDDGIVTALWISQSASAFPLMPDDSVQLSCDLWASDWNGSSFGAPYSLAQGLAIASTPHAIRLSDGRILAAAIRHKDDLSGTNADTEGALLNWKSGSGAVTDLSSDDLCDGHARVAKLSDGSVAVVWAKKEVAQPGAETGDELWYQKVWPTPTAAVKALGCPSIADLGVTVDASGNIVAMWNAGSSEGSDIYRSTRQTSTGLWSLPQQVTHDLSVEKMLSLGLLGGSPVCAYVKTEASVQDHPETMPDGSVKTVHGLVLGNSDLCVLTCSQFPDLELSDSDVSISPAPSPGGVVTLSATPHCWGDTQQTAKVTFYKGNPASGGTAIGSATQAIPAGGSATFTVSWTVPSTAPPPLVYAKVDSDNSISEADEENNVGKVGAFLPDLSATGPFLAGATGTTILVQAQIANGSEHAASDVEWEMRTDGPTGIILGAGTIPSLAGGDARVVSVLVDASTLPPSGVNIWVCADPRELTPDSDHSNNASVGMISVLPDIAVRHGSASYAVGTARVLVGNDGVRETGSFAVRAMGDGATLGEVSVQSIQPGEQTEVAIQVAPGNSYSGITLIADPSDAVEEMRADNNMAAVAVSNYATIGQVRTLRDGVRVSLSGKIITASFGDCIYVEEDDRSCGIKVMCSTPPPAGTTATISGSTSTQGIEQVLLANQVTAGSQAEVAPVGLVHRDLGGHFDRLGFLDPEAKGALYNLGLLVQVFGVVTAVGDGYIYIDDGSYLRDGTLTNLDENRGIRVVCGPSGYAPGDVVEVTGISSWFEMPVGHVGRRILTRTADDIRKVAGPSTQFPLTFDCQANEG